MCLSFVELVADIFFEVYSEYINANTTLLAAFVMCSVMETYKTCFLLFFTDCSDLPLFLWNLAIGIGFDLIESLNMDMFLGDVVKEFFGD